MYSVPHAATQPSRHPDPTWLADPCQLVHGRVIRVVWQSSIERVNTLVFVVRHICVKAVHSLPYMFSWQRISCTPGSPSLRLIATSGCRDMMRASINRQYPIPSILEKQVQNPECQPLKHPQQPGSRARRKTTTPVAESRTPQSY